MSAAENPKGNFLRQGNIFDELPAPVEGKSGWPWTRDIIRAADGKLPDGASLPKISVVIPSYNQGCFIEETIRSVLLQGYPNTELIIIDGGSQDGTLDIIHKYEPWISYWVSEPDRGQSHAINKGIKNAGGDILLWLNSDDICLPGAFQRVVMAFQQDPETAIVTGQARLIDAQANIIGELRSRFSSWEELATNPGNSIRQISSFFARRLFDDLGLVDEDLQIAMDTELLVRFTQQHVPLILDEYLTAYRVHGDTKSAHNFIQGYIESDRTRRKYLNQRALRYAYDRRSASNWLSLSGSQTMAPIARFSCWSRAVIRKPSVLFTRGCWSSLLRIFFPRHQG